MFLCTILSKVKRFYCPCHKDRDYCPLVNSPTNTSAHSLIKSCLGTENGVPTSITVLPSVNPHDFAGVNSFPSSIASSSHRPPQSIYEEAFTPTKTPSINYMTFHEGGFAHSQNITIGTAYMIDNGLSETQRQPGLWEKKVRSRLKKERRAEEKKKMEKALQKLAEHVATGAMLNSREQEYAPRCNEDTRWTICNHMVKWGQRLGSRHMLWLSGLAAVGKSAVAQSVAEELKQEGLLGAAFFFSRLDNRTNPDLVIPTIAYQLALLLPEYQQIIVQILVNDPLILNENRRSLFETLIVYPFRILSSRPHDQPNFQRPVVIILDGLDECHTCKAQCEFVEMIDHYVRTDAGLCLRWIICSRPEPALKAAFPAADCNATCIHYKLEVDDHEAQEDARRILEKGFAEIQERYPDQVYKDWPGESHVRFIASRASGHLGFATFIIWFIGDEEYDDPHGQLNICLRFLKYISSSEDPNPLQALDLLYTQILSLIPHNILPTTRHILGLYLFSNYGSRDAVLSSNFLGIDQASYYRALQRLHSVLVVPPVSDATIKNIRIYHTSFSDYLKDPVRSGHFSLDERIIQLDIGLRGLKWLSYHHRDASDQQLLQELTWIPPEACNKAITEALTSFSFIPCWEACPQVLECHRPALMEALDKFDFGLDYSGSWPSDTRAFAFFVRWLASLGVRQTALGVPDINHKNSPKSRITISHVARNPDAFIAPFLKKVVPSRNDVAPFEVIRNLDKASGDVRYTIFFQLGKFKPTYFRLVVGSTVQPLFSSPEIV